MVGDFLAYLRFVVEVATISSTYFIGACEHIFVKGIIFVEATFDQNVFGLKAKISYI